MQQTDENRRSPLLKDLLSFLEIGFRFVLENVTQFYKKEDHNIAFLSLIQKPMVAALNSGNSLHTTKIQNVKMLSVQDDRWLIQIQLY